jgi:hypothetical protein
MSSEQEPLLPSSDSQERPEQSERGLLSTWRIRTAEALESAYVHKLVITLVRLPTPHYVSFPLTNTSVDRHRCHMRPGGSRIYPINPRLRDPWG